MTSLWFGSIWRKYVVCFIELIGHNRSFSQTDQCSYNSVLLVAKSTQIDLRPDPWFSGIHLYVIYVATQTSKVCHLVIYHHIIDGPLSSHFFFHRCLIYEVNLSKDVIRLKRNPVSITLPTLFPYDPRFPATKFQGPEVLFYHLYIIFFLM